MTIKQDKTALDLVEIWQNVLGELEVNISKPNFQTWFKNTFLLEFKKGYFTVGVPTFFIENWLKGKYLKEIYSALQKQIEEKLLGVNFKITAPPPEIAHLFNKQQLIHRPVDNSKQNQTPENKIFSPSLLRVNLNDDYKFDDFIVGATNQLSYAAAQAVANKPGQLYNPLYIYGDSGLGKTHLMQAIGHAFSERFPEKRIIYTTTENFLNDFISAVESGHGRAKDFKDRYRNIDLLLIDDIQFFGNKESTQDEFFHTFNHLYQNKKQVVLTSDRPPKEIKGLETRLKTRFEGGIVADIAAPDLEMREAILRHKAKKQQIEIENEVITYIAKNITSSVRELEGALARIIAACSITNSPITKERVIEILSGFIEEKKEVITFAMVIKEVHRYYHVAIEDIIGRKRHKDIIIPRQITMYLLYNEASLSFPQIGREMGGKDHSTVMHGCKKIQESLTTNHQIKEDIGIIKEKIYSAIR